MADLGVEAVVTSIWLNSFKKWLFFDRIGTNMKSTDISMTIVENQILILRPVLVFHNQQDMVLHFECIYYTINV